MKKIDYNVLLRPLFDKRRSGMLWTAWAKHLKKIKIERFWVEEDNYGNVDPDDLLRMVNSKRRRCFYVVGGRKPKRGRNSGWKVEVYLVPPTLAQKILVLGGVP